MRLRFLCLICGLGCAHSAFSTDPVPAGELPAKTHVPRVHVDSTAFASIGYSRRLHALELEFIDGSIYRYLDVPPSLHKELMASDSKAAYYNRNVRGRYRSIHVRPR